jgi:fructan beta-fructosidase
MKLGLILAAILFASCQPTTEGTSTRSSEKHRPLIHFSPEANWMNDPNGLVYYNGTYHLFFQYYPDSTVWGPMHWGHATSTDLFHWDEKEIALYPDSLGYIFSGSAVVDSFNTSGFGKDGLPPLVAIFTYHDTLGVKAGRNNYQTQGLAFSNDGGKSWAKYDKNPVLLNPGIIDFRDPKVFWHSETEKWIMSLAIKDRIGFFSSPDLKNWTKESEFGQNSGAHGGVWECPDLFPIVHDRDTLWVLFVSINPGGPNGGSATQYFIGDFDGKQFTSDQNDTRWIDYGPDNYAGVTWSNVGNRKLFIGWMSNWLYGQQVPTQRWRSAMTVPRDIGIKKIGNNWMLTSQPVPEMDKLISTSSSTERMHATILDLHKKFSGFGTPCRIKFITEQLNDFAITFSNEKDEKLIFGYDKKDNAYYIDRSHSGVVDFEKSFAGRFTAPRIARGNTMEIEIILDNSSIEVFADSGLSVLTAIFFPELPYSSAKVESAEGVTFESIFYNALSPIRR